MNLPTGLWSEAIGFFKCCKHAVAHKARSGVFGEQTVPSTGGDFNDSIEVARAIIQTEDPLCKLRQLS